jgi:hypothetical protein
MLCTNYKMYTKILNEVPTSVLGILLPQEQNGFRKGRTCTDSH